jgi:hypothetical protein
MMSMRGTFIKQQDEMLCVCSSTCSVLPKLIWDELQAVAIILKQNSLIGKFLSSFCEMPIGRYE